MEYCGDSSSRSAARAPRRAWAMPAIAELAVVAAMFVAHRSVGEFALAEYDLGFRDLSPLKDAPLRMKWILSWAALLFAGLVVAAVAIAILREALRLPTGRAEVSAGKLAAAVGGVVLACALIGTLNAYFGSQLTGVLRPPRLDDLLSPLTTVTNTTTAAATVLVLAAVCAVLRRHLMREAPDGAEDIARDRIKALLYLGAALLMIGAVEVQHLYAWPAEFVADVEERADAHEIARTASTAVGVMGSLQLVAIFVPAFILLRDGGMPSAVAGEPVADRGRQYFGKALEGGRLVLAVLAPVLGTWLDQSLG